MAEQQDPEQDLKRMSGTVAWGDLGKGSGVSATVANPGPGRLGVDAATMPAPSISSVSPTPTEAGRRTVLPRPTDGPDGELLAAHRFRSLGSLGEGAMGEVSLAFDEDIGRTVAIKRLHKDLSHPGFIDRFADEVRTIGRLEHPNIVPIHDVGVDDEGRLYFVMKHVDA